MNREEILYIYDTMKNIKNKTPVLLIGGASLAFKKMYTGNIYHLENTEDIKELISSFYGITLEKPLVIEDLSLLYRDTLLLKFIEESKIPLILLASEDNISIPLQSRIKTYIKYPSKNINCIYQKILDSQNYIIEHDLTGSDLDEYIADNCPDLARINRLIINRKNKDKLIQILGGIQDGKLTK